MALSLWGIVGLLALSAYLSFTTASTTSRSNHIPTALPPTTTTLTTRHTTNHPTTTTTTMTPVDFKRPRRRSRRCKCGKRLTKEMNKLVEDRLHDFETRYLRHLQEDRDTALSRKTTNGRLDTLERRLYKMGDDVTNTREALSVMQNSLQQLKQDMQHATSEVTALNVSFRQLDVALQNVSRFVRNMENLLPAGATVCPPEGCEVTVPPTVHTYPRHCDEVYQQGGMQFKGDYYIMIKPDGVSHPFKVLCKIYNNSGWTVIQKREDGSVDFFRNWGEYKKGFGSLEGEFWLGNDYIHYLTVQEPTMLRIELQDWEDRDYEANYGSFRIDDEEGLYRLHIAHYQGDAGDSLRSHWENHDGMPFSTKDRDNDGRYYDNCAEHFHGAWWFNNCFDSHLNGKYYHKGFHKNYFQRDGLQWNTIHMYSSLRAVHMMLKPAHNTHPPPSRPTEPATDPDMVKAVRSRESGRRERGKGRRGGARRERQKA